METSFQARNIDPNSATKVTSFLSELERLEGNESPLTHSEWSALEASPSFQGHLWTITPDATAKDESIVGLVAYQCEDGPELFTACLPEHREIRALEEQEGRGI